MDKRGVCEKWREASTEGHNWWFVGIVWLVCEKGNFPLWNMNSCHRKRQWVQLKLEERHKRERGTSQGDITCQVSACRLCVCPLNCVCTVHLWVYLYNSPVCCWVEYAFKWFWFHISSFVSNSTKDTPVSDEMQLLCSALSRGHNDSVSTESVSYLPVLHFMDLSRSKAAVLWGPLVTLYATHTWAQRHTPGHGESYPKGSFEWEKEAKMK